MFVSANGRSDKILNSPLYTYFIINDKGTRAKKGRAILHSLHTVGMSSLARLDFSVRICLLGEKQVSVIRINGCPS